MPLEKGHYPRRNKRFHNNIGFPEQLIHFREMMPQQYITNLNSELRIRQHILITEILPLDHNISEVLMHKLIKISITFGRFPTNEAE